MPLSSPSNHRVWTRNQALLPHAEFQKNKVRIHNIRNCHFRTENDFDLRHYDKTFDLQKIKSLDYILTPFGKWWNGPAHAILSFGFENGDHVCVSVEVRKEEGEEYSSFKGLFKFYELMVVIADENDVVKLRTNIRKNQVYCYPLRANKSTIRKLFVSLLERANQLKQRPEYYHTFRNSCISNLKLPFSWTYFAPGYSDRHLYRMGLIKTDLPFKKAKEFFNITARAQKARGSKNFSQKIRQRGSATALVGPSKSKYQLVKSS